MIVFPGGKINLREPQISAARRYHYSERPPANGNDALCEQLITEQESEDGMSRLNDAASTATPSSSSDYYDEEEERMVDTMARFADSPRGFCSQGKARGQSLCEFGCLNVIIDSRFSRVSLKSVNGIPPKKQQDSNSSHLEPMSCSM